MNNRKYALKKLSEFLTVVAENVPHDWLPDAINIDNLATTTELNMGWEDLGNLIIAVDANGVIKSTIFVQTQFEVKASDIMISRQSWRGLSHCADLAYYEMEAK